MLQQLLLLRCGGLAMNTMAQLCDVHTRCQTLSPSPEAHIRWQLPGALLLLKLLCAAWRSGLHPLRLRLAAAGDGLKMANAVPVLVACQAHWR
jgi:hypothetical protein